MKKNIILVAISLMILIVYIIINFYIQTKSITPEEKASFKLKSIEIPYIGDLIKTKYNDNDVMETIGKWELWRYMRPKTKEEKKEEGKSFIVYKLKRVGSREIIYNPQNKKESWEFYGVFIVNKKPFAIFYNPNSKEKYKIVTIGDKLTKNLFIDNITSSKIIVKFPISEKEYSTLELNVFYVDIKQFKKKIERELQK